MKISHIILSILTILVILAGIYFFTDVFGDREARKAVEEVVAEIPATNLQINESIPQVANDPDAGVFINDKNIQIEREEASQSTPDETSSVYVQTGTSPEVRTTNDTTSVPVDTGSGSSVPSAEGVENETGTLEMNIPPVPDM